MASDTTPPVSTAELAAVTLVNVKSELTVLQKFVSSDKSAIVAATVHIAILLITALGFHLSGDAVAILGSIVGAGLAYFVSINLGKK